MSSWNIDKKIEHLEKQLQIVGYLSICVYRILMAKDRMCALGLKPLPWQKEGCEYFVWVFGIGLNTLNIRPYYYGHTIHEAYLKMQKNVDRSDQVKKLKRRLTKYRGVVKNNRKEIPS